MSIGGVIFIFVYVLLLTAAWAGWSAAPWLPTKRTERELVADLLTLRPGETLYDLGCGDGVVLFTLADRYPEARLIGYEVFIVPYLLGNLRRLLGGRRYRNVRIRFGDLFRQDLRDASAVFCFLMAKSYGRLGAKFARELKDECRVMVEAWPIPGLTPVRDVKQTGKVRLFLYQGSQFRQNLCSKT